MSSNVCLVYLGSSLCPHQRSPPHHSLNQDSTGEAVLLKLKLPSALSCNFSKALLNPFLLISWCCAVTEYRLTVNGCRAESRHTVHYGFQSWHNYQNIYQQRALRGAWSITKDGPKTPRTVAPHCCYSYGAEPHLHRWWIHILSYIMS